jgi:hypothetical protein
MSLYSSLVFFHIAGLMAFLFGHGVSGGASLALRGPVSGSTRSLLRLSQRSAMVSNPALLVTLITGIWMTFAGHWSSMVWPWASLVILVVVGAAMFYIARPYYRARDAARGPDDALARLLSMTRPLLALWMGVVALALLLWLMVFKPF